MTVRVIEPRPEESYVQLPVTSGGEFVTNSHEDRWALRPSRALGSQSVALRCFAPPPENRISEGCFEIRFDPEEMREALRLVAELDR